MELLTTLSAIDIPFLNVIWDFGNDILTGTNDAGEPIKGAIFNLQGIINLLVGFLLNLLFVGIVVRFFYYPKCKRSEFFFTFILIFKEFFFNKL